MLAGVGLRGRFRKIPESSGVCWCRYRRVPESSRRQIPEGSGEFGRTIPKHSFRIWRVPGGRFRRQVAEGSGNFQCVGVGSGEFRGVVESSRTCWCRFRRQGSEGSGEFRCGFVVLPP